MTTQVIDICVEAGLKAEQDLLASVCAGDADYGLLFWRPSDHALVMPRRLSRLEVSPKPARPWPISVGQFCCVKAAASRSHSLLPR